MAGARYLLVTWDGGGNVPPLLGLATRLVRRGHDVVTLGPQTLAPRFERHGLHLCTRTSDMVSDTAGAADDVLAEIDARRPDAIVTDYMAPGALCAAEATGIPTAALVHTLYRPGRAGQSCLWEWT